ncbi:hypothetical protein J6590_009886 [Homalodisca vitripennis]|nr:hypothetical protein J6590_009886 [Homalodisca vitripennis]
MSANIQCYLTLSRDSRKKEGSLSHRTISEELTSTYDDLGMRCERDAFDTLFDHAPDKLQVVKKSLVTFVNKHLNKVNLEVSDLDTQFHDGVYLTLLMGLLEGFFVPLYSFHLTPQDFDQKVHNVSFAFELMQDVGLAKPKARPEVIFLNLKHLRMKVAVVWEMIQIVTLTTSGSDFSNSSDEDELRPTHRPQTLPIPHQPRARGRPRLARPNEQDKSNEDNTDSEDGTGWVEVDKENDNDYDHLFTFHEEPGIKHCPPRNSSPALHSTYRLPPYICSNPSFKNILPAYVSGGVLLSVGVNYHDLIFDIDDGEIVETPGCEVYVDEDNIQVISVGIELIYVQEDE